MGRLLTIRDLRTHFFLTEGTARAVDGVDLEIPARATVGLVGESGCGKSVTALSVLRPGAGQQVAAAQESRRAGAGERRVPAPTTD